MKTFRSHHSPTSFLGRLLEISPALLDRIVRTDHRATSLNLTTTDSHAAHVIEHEAARAGLVYSRTLEASVYHFTLKNFAR